MTTSCFFHLALRCIPSRTVKMKALLPLPALALGRAVARRNKLPANPGTGQEKSNFLHVVYCVTHIVVYTVPGHHGQYQFSHVHVTRRKQPPLKPMTFDARGLLLGDWPAWCARYHTTMASTEQETKAPATSLDVKKKKQPTSQSRCGP